MEQENCYQVDGETLVIKLSKELDHDEVGVIREKTDVLFSGNRIRNVIFDYSRTEFMDSSGIGLVMGRYRQVRYLKGNIYIVGVNDAIKRILEISGLYRVAYQLDTVQEALSQIQKEI